jgi:hypothetical protein
LRALQRLAQARQSHRFQQVVRSTQLEGFQCMGFVGRAEDHLRTRATGQPLRQADTVDAGHVDVQQQHVRLEFTDGGQRRFAVGGAADNFDLGTLAEQRGHAGARQWFIVDDQHARHAAPPGRCSNTV